MTASFPGKTPRTRASAHAGGDYKGREHINISLQNNLWEMGDEMFIVVAAALSHVLKEDDGFKIA